MIRVYFVRHAQPEYDWEDDRTRPLTAEGKEDAKKVFEFLKDKNIDKFYCSPYTRSMDTIAEKAEYFGKEIIADERLREREKGKDGNQQGMFQKRWADLDFHEEGGESIAMVQKRNIAALRDILSEFYDATNEEEADIVIGTHGTALSSILHYYESSYNCNSFLRIIDWMPYIIELDFDRDNCISKQVHLYIEKEFQGKKRADKSEETVKVNFYNSIDDEKLKFAVIIAKIQGKWVFCKHKERDTYEVPGGHREAGEDIIQTAMRELREETGAIDFELKEVSVYSVTRHTKGNETTVQETFGMLYYANIKSFEKELHHEIESLWITDQLPENWTYPLIQPKLIAKAEELGYV